MNVTGSKYLLWMWRIWRDEACTSTVEGAILACATAAAMLVVLGLKSELPQIFGLVSRLVGSLLA